MVGSSTYTYVCLCTQPKRQYSTILLFKLDVIPNSYLFPQVRLGEVEEWKVEQPSSRRPSVCTGTNIGLHIQGCHGTSYDISWSVTICLQDKSRYWIPTCPPLQGKEARWRQLYMLVHMSVDLYGSAPNHLNHQSNIQHLGEEGAIYI